MGQGSPGFFEDDEDNYQAEALPLDAEDRASTNLRSPDFQLPAPEEIAPESSPVNPDELSAPVPVAQAEAQSDVPAEAPIDGVPEESVEPGEIKGASNPAIGQALDRLNAPPAEPGPLPRPGFENAYLRNQQVEQKQGEQERAGSFKYLKSQGIRTTTDPQGNEVIDTHADGAPKWHTRKSMPYQDDQTGEWLIGTRNDRGETNAVPLSQTRGIVKTDPATGDQYFMGRDKQPVSIGTDETVVARNSIRQQRNGLNAQAAANQIAIQELHRSMIEPTKALQRMQGSATGTEEDPGDTVKRLENKVANLSGATDLSPEQEDDLHDAQAKITQFVVKHPDYQQTKDLLSSTRDEIATRQNAIDRARAQATVLAHAENGPLLATILPPKTLAGLTGNGDAPDSTDALTGTAAVAAETGTTMRDALPKWLLNSKASGLTNIHGRPIDDVIAEAQNPPPLPEKPVPVPSKDNGVGAWGNFVGSMLNHLGMSAATVAGQIERPLGLTSLADSADQRRKWYQEAESGDFSSDNPLRPGGDNVGGNLVNPTRQKDLATGAAHVLPDIGMVATGLPGMVGLTAKAMAEGAADAGDKGESRAFGAAKEAGKTALTLALFGGAGKLAGKLTPAITAPLQRGLAAAGISIPISAAADATLNSLFGGSAVPKTPAEWAERGLFLLVPGGHAAFHEAKLPGQITASLESAKSLPEQIQKAQANIALGEEAKPIIEGQKDTLTLQRLESSLKASKDFLSRQNPKLIQKLNGKVDEAVTQASEASGTPDAATATPAPRDLPALYTEKQAALRDTMARAATAQDAGDLTSAATLSDEALGHRQDLHAAQLEAIGQITPEMRATLAKSVSPDIDVKANEARLGGSPAVGFGAAELGRQVRSLYLTPEREALIDRAASGPQEAVAQHLVDQHVGLLAAKDLEGVAQGNTISPEKAAALESLGLVHTQTDANGTRLAITDDAVPLLSQGFRQRLQAQPDRLNYVATPGTPQDLFSTLVKGGEQHFGEALQGTRPEPAKAPTAAHRVKVSFTTPESAEEKTATVPVQARGEEEAVHKAVAALHRGGREITSAEIEKAVQRSRASTADDLASERSQRVKEMQSAKNHGERQALQNRIREIDAMRSEEPAVRAEAPSTEAPPESRTPAEVFRAYSEEGKKATLAVQKEFNRERRLFSALGIKKLTLIGEKGDGPALLAHEDGAVFIHGDRLSEDFANLSARGVNPSEWASHALREELIHVAQFKAAGPKWRERYADLWNDPALPQALKDAAAKSYEGFNDLSDHQKAAEAVRMVIDGRWKGTITERIFKAIQDVVDYLKGLDVGESPMLKQMVEQTEGVLREAGAKIGEEPRDGGLAASRAPRPAEDAYRSAADAVWKNKAATPMEEASAADRERILSAYREAVAEAKTPSVSVADVLERAGYTLDDAEAGKRALAGMQRSGEVEALAGGDWSLSDSRKRAWGIQTADSDTPKLLVRMVERERGLSASRPASNTDDVKNLVAVHNLSTDNLRHAIKVGGIAVPSMAIIRADKSNFDQFGEITLVAHPDLIDPKKSKDAKTFNADVYSPRYPKVTTFLKDGDGTKLNGELQKYRDEVKDPSYSFSTGSVVENIKDNGFARSGSEGLVQYAYARETGLIEPVAGEDQYDAASRARKAIEAADQTDGVGPWFKDKATGLGIEPVEKIFNGYTNSGNRRYLPHDLDTVVKLMKKELRNGEGFNYGVGSIRSKVAKQFRTIEAIQKSRGDIITKPQMDALKKEIDDEFIALEEKATKGRASQGGLDSFSDDLAAMAEGGAANWKHLREMYPDGVPPEIGEFLQKLKSLPTEYFESKVQRAVGIHEFTSALVPHDAPEDLVGALRARGLDVQTYDPKDSDSRVSALERISRDSGTLFASRTPEQRAIDRATGVTKETPEKIEVDPGKALKRELQQEAKAAKEGARAGRDEMREKLGVKIAALKDQLSGSVSKDRAYREGLRQAERAGKAGRAAGERETTAQMKEEEAWAHGDWNRVRDDLVSFVQNDLPPEKRGKFISQITKALTPPTIGSDPAMMYRRAFRVMGKIRGATEDWHRENLIRDIEKIGYKSGSSPGVDINYQNRIKATVARYAFTKLSAGKRAELESRQKFVKQMRIQGKDSGIPQAEIDELGRLDHPHIGELPTEALEALRDKLQVLDARGRLTVDLRGRARDRLKAFHEDALKISATNPFDKRRENADLPPGAPGSKTDLTIAQRLKNQLGRAWDQAKVTGDRALMPIDALFDILGDAKGTYQGWLFRHMRGPIDLAYNETIHGVKEINERLEKVITQHKLTQGDSRRIATYATVMQEGGRERLIAQGIPEARIDQIVKSITPGEMSAYREMRDTMDSLYPKLREEMRQLYNQDVPAVKDYFPMPRDWSEYAASQEQPRPLDPKTGMPVALDELATWKYVVEDVNPKNTTSTAKGFTKERVQGANTAVRLDAFNTYRKHIHDVLHLLNTQRDLQMLGEITRSPLAQEKFGRVGRQFILDWLDTVARNGSVESFKRIPMLDWFRKLSSAGMIGFRLSSTFKHASNAALAIPHIGAENYLHGLWNSQTKEGQKFMNRYFAETTAREGGEQAIEELTKASKVAAFGFTGIRYIDKVDAQSAALGYYLGALKAKGLDPSKFASLPVDDIARQDALVRMRRVVASANPKDAPQVLSRGTGLGGNVSWAKSIFQFGNIFLDRWSNIRHDMLTAGTGAGNHKYAATVAVGLLAAIAAESGIVMGVRSLTNAVTGHEDKEEETFLGESGHHALRQLPYVSQLLSMAMWKRSGIPVMDAPVQVMGEIGDTIKATTDSSRMKHIIGAVGGAAAVLGLPGAGQATDLAKKSIGTKENETQKLMREHGIKRTPEPDADAPKRKDIIAAVREKSMTAHDAMRATIKGGGTQAQAQNLVKEARKDPSLVTFEHLPLKAALEVFQAADPEHRRLFREALARKRASGATAAR